LTFTGAILVQKKNPEHFQSQEKIAIIDIDGWGYTHITAL